MLVLVGASLATVAASCLFWSSPRGEGIRAAESDYARGTCGWYLGGLPPADLAVVEQEFGVPYRLTGCIVSDESRAFESAYNARLRELIAARGLPANSRRGEFLNVRDLVVRLRTPERCANQVITGDARASIVEGAINVVVKGQLVAGHWRADAITGFRSDDGLSFCVGAWQGGRLVQLFHIRDGSLLQRVDEGRIAIEP